jgi:hypothetical protein
VAETAELGDRDVVVTNPDGGTATMVRGFTVAPAPLVNGVTPAAISRGRATTIDIAGANFVAGAKVGVSGSGISSVVTTFVDSARLRATVAVGSAATTGPRSVTVTNPDAGVTVRSGALAVVDPAPAAPVTITALSPRRLGQNASWRTVTVTGTGFLPTTVVSIGGTGVTVKSRTYVSATKLTLMVSVDPTASVGDRAVTATNEDGGVSTLAAGFTVTSAPVIASLSPSVLPRGRTTTVVISGANFASGVSVTISGAGINSIATTRLDAVQLRVAVAVAAGASTGARSVTVRNTDAGATTKDGALTIS